MLLFLKFKNDAPANGKHCYLKKIIKLNYLPEMVNKGIDETKNHNNIHVLNIIKLFSFAK